MKLSEPDEDPIAATFGPGEDDDQGDPLYDEANDPDDEPLVPGPERLPDYAGHRVTELATRLSGSTERIARALDLGDEIVVVGVLEVVGVGYGGDGPLKLTQSLKVVDLYEIAGPVAYRFLNDVRHRWDQAHLADPLPFKTEGDEQLAEAIGLAGDDHRPVVVIFDDGTRAVWPDDFAAEVARPLVGDALVPPGGSEVAEVAELLDHATGEPVATAGPADTDDDEPEGDEGQ